ncbi:MAG: squalene--hopene cyclase [Planctomycetaceae bacterium]|nr:squalene--hopene cyclase [Planctomycetaceae bacterium]
MMRRLIAVFVLLNLTLLASGRQLHAQGDWEVTPNSRLALDRGLDWLARNQGPKGNWDSEDLGLVSMGALAFLADGHAPGRGKYGDTVQKSLDFVIRNAKPTGLLNTADTQRDMYNHGLATFVLGQAFGMTGDARIGQTLDRALKLITNTQCDDGGWDYRARRITAGHDLSLAVMQAKALRSAVDSGLEVPPEVISAAIKGVREHYHSSASGRNADLTALKKAPGQFHYGRHGGGGATIAMAACGVVCLQEFGQYDDWRIPKNMDVIVKAVRDAQVKPGNGDMPFDSYTLYYVGQALYQVGEPHWRQSYPLLREGLIRGQTASSKDPARDGSWHDNKRVSGKPGDLYATSVACFILAIPNRFLPILQEGKIDSIRSQFQR